MSSASSTALPADLSKLNVSQLKALCKERRIVGYSKLGKAAIICKLAEVVSRTPCSTSTQKRTLNTENETQTGIAIPVPQTVDLRKCAAPPDAHISSGSVDTQTPAQTPAVVPLASVTPMTPIEKNCTPPSLAAQGTVSKRLPSEISHGQVPAIQPAKKRKVVGFSSATASGGSTLISAAPANVPGHGISPVPPVSCGPALLPEQAGGRHLVRTQTRGTFGKRFKPPTTMRPAAATNDTTSGNVEYAQITSILHGEEGARTGAQLTAIRHQHLDFPAPMAPPALSHITLPPSLAERRLVQRWAIILSGLSEKEQFRCCFVSKLIRYAVYSSAYYKLCKDFSGQRLSLVLQRIGQSSLMMNFWPYLRQREQEILERKNAVMSSFLFPALQGPNDLISARLWASPDNEKQLTVALRYLLTRLWFGLSTITWCAKSVRASWLYDVVTDVEEIVKGEIWYVTTRNSRSGHLQAFHVLEATCEVLGFVEGAPSNDSLRADWAAYVQQRKESPDNRSPLCEAMRWADHGEYERGISRHWLRRTAQMGPQGAALRTIAERYTLACVVGNSVSGSWMSAPQMAQEFAGLAQRVMPRVAVKAVSNLSLFLPAHHHVESVHFTTTDRRLLHPALAIVQTPAREYYILRDNGMEVGSEEDGVARVWMRILGCNARGELVEQAGVSFEELKAYVQDL